MQSALENNDPRAFFQAVLFFLQKAGLRIVFGIILLFVGSKLIKLLMKGFDKGKRKGKRKLDKSVHSFLRSFLKIILYILLYSAVAYLWGVPTTAFVTVFTTIGVAIGFSAQGVLANFAGGILILVFHPFKVGDYIECGEVSGTVKDITVIYTILTSGDNKKITIPNGTLTNSNVINYSARTERRVDLVVSASYEDDIDKVEKVLSEVASKNPLVLKDPAPIARLSAHNADSLDYHFRVWCKSEDYWEVYYSSLEEIKKAFDANDITIPFKQVDIHNV